MALVAVVALAAAAVQASSTKAYALQQPLPQVPETSTSTRTYMRPASGPLDEAGVVGPYVAFARRRHAARAFALCLLEAVVTSSPGSCCSRR